MFFVFCVLFFIVFPFIFFFFSHFFFMSFFFDFSKSSHFFFFPFSHSGRHKPKPQTSHQPQTSLRFLGRRRRGGNYLPNHIAVWDLGEGKRRGYCPPKPSPSPSKPVSAAASRGATNHWANLLTKELQMPSRRQHRGTSSTERDHVPHRRPLVSKSVEGVETVVET